MAGWPSFVESADIGEPADALAPENQALSASPAPRPASPRLRLEKIADVKRELSRLYREARRGEITTQTATRLAYLLNMMAQLIETAELEKRVALLEQPHGGR